MCSDDRQLNPQPPTSDQMIDRHRAAALVSRLNQNNGKMNDAQESL